MGDGTGIEANSRSKKGRSRSVSKDRMYDKEYSNNSTSNSRTAQSGIAEGLTDGEITHVDSSHANGEFTEDSDYSSGELDAEDNPSRQVILWQMLQHFLHIRSPTDNSDSMPYVVGTRLCSGC